MGSSIKPLLYIICLLIVQSVLAVDFSSSRSNKELENLLALSPIGDSMHASVYWFIEEALLKSKTLSKTELEEHIKVELDIIRQGNKDKPYIAEISESQMGHVLRDLCHSRQRCEKITLYTKDGLAIASASKNDLIFREKQNINDDLDCIGVLGPNVEEKLGLRKLTTQEGKVYSEVTTAICYQEERKCSFLVTEKQGLEEPVIGYVRYIMSSN